jgi:hypothetical protein
MEAELPDLGAARAKAGRERRRQRRSFIVLSEKHLGVDNEDDNEFRVEYGVSGPPVRKGKHNDRMTMPWLRPPIYIHSAILSVTLH